MATATQVTIRVVVDGKDAGPAIDGINTKLGEIGVKGSASVRQAGQAMDQLGGHVATPLDSVRLLSQEFGLRLPRAIEAMLSRMPGVTAAISGMIGGLAGIAAIDVFAHLIEGAKRAYDEFISLNAIIDKYNENIEKARQADIPNAHSIETARLRLQEQTQAGSDLHQQAKATQNGGFRNLAVALATGNPALGADAAIDIYQGHEFGVKASNADVGRDELAHRTVPDQEHADILRNLENAHAGDAALTGSAKTEAERRKKVATYNEEQRYNKALDLALENPSAPNAGEAEKNSQIDTANKEAAAQNIVLNREMNLAIMKSDDAAAQARLTGEDLYYRKFRDDIRETTRELINQGKAAEIPARVREINEKYFADASDRFVKAQNESGARVRQASASGLTGAARIYADQDIQVNANNTKYQDDERQTANEAAAQKTNQDLLQLQQEFTQQMDAIEESRVDSTLNGYQRIDAEATKTADQVRESFEKSWGGADVDQGSAQYIAARKAMQDALTSVDASAAEQRRQLHDQMAEETLRYDEQAAAAERRVKQTGVLGWTSDYRSAIAEIRAQEEQREQDLKNQLAKGSVDWENYCQRLRDVHGEANAQIIAQQQQLQHQVAGQLQQAFTDPLGFIKSRMEQMFFEVVASWLLQLKVFKQLFGSTMSGLGGPTGGGGGLLGGLGGMVRPTFGGSPTASAAGAAAAGTAAASSVAAAASSAGNSPSISSAAPNFAPHFSIASSTSGGGESAAGVTGSARTASLGKPAETRTAEGTVGSAISSANEANSVATMVRTNYSAMKQRQAAGATSSLSSAAPGLTGDTPGIALPGITPEDQTISAPGLPNQSPAGPHSSLPSAGDQTGGAAKTLNAAGNALTVGTASYEGYSATKSAYLSDSVGGTFKGAAQDAMAGAAIGMVVGGPAGALVGAAIGAGVGLAAGVIGMITGEGPRLKARDYYRKNLFPAMESERNSDSADYQTAISNVNRIASDGMTYMTQHFGKGAAQWVDDNYLKKEQKLADAQIEARAKGGAYAVQMSAAQFHTGGRITGFGDLSTGYREGFIHAELGEGVVHGTAMSMHGPAIDAMNSGATPSDVAKMYLASTPRSDGNGLSSTVQGHTFVIQALDSQSFDRYMKSGGAKITQKHLNNLAGQYAGDASNG